MWPHWVHPRCKHGPVYAMTTARRLKPKAEGRPMRANGETLAVRSLVALQSTIYMYHRLTTYAFLRGLILLLRRPTGHGSSSTMRDCSSVASRVCDRFRQSSLFPIDLTYSKETLNTYHLSRGICWLVPRVRESASGDSLSLLCLIFRTDWKYSFIAIFNIIGQRRERLWVDTLKGCYINVRLLLLLLILLKKYAQNQWKPPKSKSFTK